jgi:hypothetical protein
VGGELAPTEEMDTLGFFARNELPVNIAPRKKEIIATAYCHPAGLIFTRLTSVRGRQWLAEQQMEKTPG